MIKLSKHRNDARKKFNNIFDYLSSANFQRIMQSNYNSDIFISWHAAVCKLLKVWMYSSANNEWHVDRDALVGRIDFNPLSAGQCFLFYSFTAFPDESCLPICGCCASGH